MRVISSIHHPHSINESHHCSLFSHHLFTHKTVSMHQNMENKCKLIIKHTAYLLQHEIYTQLKRCVTHTHTQNYKFRQLFFFFIEFSRIHVILRIQKQAQTNAHRHFISHNSSMENSISDQFL